jgi:hypothetical protein
LFCFCRTKPDRIRLKINDPVLADDGAYKIKVVNRDMTAEAVMNVIVQCQWTHFFIHQMTIFLFIPDPPTITIESPDIVYYEAEEYHEFVCTFDGVPKPAVYWNWQKCEHAGCTPRPSQWQRVQQSLNIPEVRMGDNTATLSVIARESGFYQCEATNKEGKLDQEIDFFVSGMNPEIVPSVLVIRVLVARCR